jgi:menaquinone-dependent protoporphyrinogen oxidase
MKVLVSAASRHGSTAEIARAIGYTLSSAGLEVDIRRPEEVTTMAPYVGVVLGSGVYAGRWLEPMKKLIERESAALAVKPVWLFSSGPLGDPPKPTDEPTDGVQLRESLHAIDHAVFPGRLDRNELGFTEKAIVSLVHAADGDFRSWQPIASWATTIAEALQATIVEAAVR